VEDYVLTSPSQITSYRVMKLFLDWEGQRIKINVKAPSGERIYHTYQGSTAVTLMTALNKMDLTTNSLHKRILERLETDGVLPDGSVTGSPD